VTEQRRLRRASGRRRGHRRQRLVIDHDQLGRILCGRQSLGDDQHHSLADKTHAILCQRHLVRRDVRRSIGIDEGDIGWALRCRCM